KLYGAVLAMFAVLFCLAAVCRFGSAGFLSRQSEPLAGVLVDRRVGWGEMLSRIRGEPSGRLAMYLLATQVAVQTASPYFVPYMLHELQFSYLEFTLLAATSLMAKFAFLPLWGRFAQGVGARRLLLTSGVAIVPLSALWLFSNSLGWL